MRRGTVPVVTLGGWQIVDADGDPVPGPVTVATPQEAVDTALAKATATSPNADPAE